MTTNQQFEQLEKAFFHDGYQLAMKAVEANLEQEALHQSLQEMYAAIDGLIDSLFVYAQQQNQVIDCKKGCSWCCHQPVFALDYELDYLLAFMEKSFDDDTFSGVQEKAKQKQTKLGTLKGDELMNAKYPCPLLKDNACSAYEARPMACRIYLSSDVKSCVHFYNQPDDKNTYPALLDMPMRLGRMMNEGFKSALKTNGIEAKEFRIEEKLI
ncbi:YkgJ family cysteine cluster protein [Draconibacterium sp. IB214405]|uniref:YkgJ family cysteine cluster protein n=1 Tax=Draconibacterium sp. IB214405 TaxID=3097352 RepID=UPI002A0EE3F9|nr:YkgJ family cysteine cluster protein [Draconibacterium sp. IB214405]MDX8340624.1 YkgJ family cysteine cluster protein [Draconibacterium sp. IB214405]